MVKLPAEPIHAPGLRPRPQTCAVCNWHGVIGTRGFSNADANREFSRVIIRKP